MQEELSQEVVQQIAQKGRDSLFFLAKAILGFDRFTKEIHKPICDMIQDYKKNTRNVLVLPRGWYKSTLATIAYPIWRAINNPEVRILLVQNTYTNACGKLGAIKQIFESNDLFKLLYPEIMPNNDCIWSKDAATVRRKGAYPEATWEAAGTGTQKTGQHYDLIIEDDTVSPSKDNLTGAMMQPTQAEIEKAIGWFRLGTPLLIEPLDSQRIVVGTRWAEGDLLGYLIDKHPEFNQLTRAVKEDENGLPDVDGDIQWPERFSQEVLDALEVDLGPYMYCNPAEAPILMGDFTEKPIIDVAIGDEVVGFHLQDKSKQNKLVKATVLDKGKLRAKTVKVYLKSGRVIRCTPEHKWLQDPEHANTRPHLTYRPICKEGSLELNCLKKGKNPKLQFVCRTPKVPDRLEDAARNGWIGGMLDADGHVSKQNICFTQSDEHNPEICETIRRTLTASEFSWIENKKVSKSPSSDKMCSAITFTITGGFNAKLRFLSSIPSIKARRIVEHLYKSRFIQEKDEVLRVEEQPEEDVYWLETTTGNYVCWGYASKNSALYMNHPTSASNQVFKREWINYYQTLPKNLLYVTAVDLASAEKEETTDPDYNVIMTCGINQKNGHVYLVHYTRKRMSPSAVINTIFDHHRAYKPVKVIIEGIGYQRTIKHWIEQKQRKLNQVFWIDVITGHKMSKVDRVRGLQPFFAANRIFIRPDHSEFERELLAFPKGKHDDMPDTMSMMLDFFNTQSTLDGEDKAERLARSPFSVDLILKELQDRVTGPAGYDMGIMSHRYNPGHRTDYVRNGPSPYAY